MTKKHRKCKKGGLRKLFKPSGCRRSPKKSVCTSKTRLVKKCRKHPRKKVPCSRVTAREVKYKNIVTKNKWTSLPSQNTSRLTTYSYAIVNRGSHAARIKIQVSPNARNFADDNQITVEGGQTGVVFPISYLFFTRLNVQSEKSGESTTLDIYFQGQSAG